MKYLFTFLTVVIFITLASSQNCINLTSQDTYCGMNNGSASVYTICCGNINSVSWSNGASGLSVTDLAPGEYSVYVQTDVGCTRTIIFYIEASTPMPLSTAFTNTTCGEANGSATMINLNPGSGFSPIYSWSTGSNQPSISNLDAGAYMVTVYEFDPTGVEGCVQTFDFIIGPSAPIAGNLNVTSTTCNEANGSIVAFASGGGGSYIYQWSSGQTSSAVNNLAPGLYNVSIQSVDGCSPLVLSGEINPSTPISGQLIPKHTTCNLPNGALEVLAEGGGNNHTYNWSNGQSTQSINNISSGGYNVTIYSSDGCTPLILSGAINPSSALVATVEDNHTTCGQSNGSISAFTNHNGSTYLWNTGATTSSLNNLSPATYTVTATDQDGCIATSTSIINSSQGFDLSVTQVGNTLVASTQIFTLYEWLNCNDYTPIPGAENMTYAPATNGLYAVAVYNGNLNGVTCRDTSDCIEFIMSATDDISDDNTLVICSPIQHDKIVITAPSHIYILDVKMYSINGQLLHQDVGVNDRQYVLDVSSYPEGNLIVQCHTSKGIITKRIMKM